MKFCFLVAAALTAGLPLASAQTPSAHHTSSPHTRLDASWMATMVSAPDHHDIADDPRFTPLLRRAFPQRQWFWHDHGRLLPTQSLIQTFTGISNGPQIQSGRYITRAGCVVHDCTDTGLLWIDTDPQSTEFIAAINPLVGGGPGSHLWLFTSDQRFNWQKPASNFHTSLNQWLASLGPSLSNETQHVILITIVRPDGIQQDLAPSELLDPPHAPSTPGAGK